MPLPIDTNVPSEPHSTTPLLTAVDHDDNEVLIPSSEYSDANQQFWRTFFCTRGTKELLIVATLIGIGIGSVVGLIPATLSDRYARLEHDFRSSDTSKGCMDYDRYEKPLPCREGSEDAQASAAWANLGVNILTLTFSPVVGAISDFHGRRFCLLLGLFLSCIPNAVFCLILLNPKMDPVWYYVSFSLTGVVNFVGLIFASLSDVIPPEYRTPAFGMLMASFYGSMSLSPTISYMLSDPIYVASLSLSSAFAAFAYAGIFLSETLPENIREKNHNDLRNQVEPNSEGRNLLSWIGNSMTRPIREVSILNRNWPIRQIAIGSFFSCAVHATDVTLLIYYIEEYLDVRPKDIASMFLVLGISGIVMQALMLQPLVRWVGEKRLLVAAFCSGILHNFLYGVARIKSTIYLAFVFGQFTKTNIPVLSSLASQNVSSHEQGRVQGALSATNALANAVGPLIMQFLYRSTPNSRPGVIFLYASGFYVIGTLFVAFIRIKPSEQPHAQAPPVIINRHMENRIEESQVAHHEHNLLDLE